jgi:hypothetical protein
MRNLFLSVLAALVVTGSVSATTVTSVSTSADGGVSCAGTIVCISQSHGPNAGGQVTATAGLGFGVSAIVDGTAVCSATIYCLGLHGNADAELDLTILGSTGTGIILFQNFALSPFGSATTNVGLPALPNDFGSLTGYTFTFGQTFHLSAVASLFCTECDAHSIARITGFGIYDNDLELLSYTAPDAQGRILATVPEPGTWSLGVIGLLAVAVRALASRRSATATGMRFWRGLGFPAG